MHPYNFKKYVLAAAVAGALGSTLVACGNNTPPNDAPTVKLLSSKAEFVTGGDVLVDLVVPPIATAAALSVTANGSDVSSAFKADPANPGHMVGLVSGLKLGTNTLLSSYGGVSATFQISNFPSTGPILSGPQETPFNCQTQNFTLPNGSKLGAATDANCSAPTVVQYLYRSTSGGALKPMPDTTVLPSDVSTTVTTAGLTVPFVVRVETGTMNRGIYQNAVLFDPTKDSTASPATAPKGWNQRLIAVHGTGCATGWYIQGAAMGVSPYTGTNQTRLGEGYAVFTNTLNHPTNSCNALLAGETTMMGKEHFIKTFGVPAFTVSVGTSGGAYTSLQVADAFPGLLDGVFIDATFPDALSIALSAMDSKLLNHYYTTNNSTAMTEAQMVSISGQKTARAWYDLALQSGRTDPVSGRVESIPTTGSLVPGGYSAGAYNAAVPAAQRWNATSNPTGARATVFDIGRNVYGVDAQGYGLRPFDNIGVQYGLAQLNAGTITVDQFLDMNASIGGYDRDGNYTIARTVGDTGAIKRAYQAGLQLGANGGLASIPVFDRSNFYDEDNYYHYQWFHFAVRERLFKANGDTRNHVMWRGGTSFPDLFGQSTAGKAERAAVGAKSLADGWPAFIKWVAAYKADTSAAVQRDKVIAAKPVEAVDGCYTLSTPPQFIAEIQTLSSTGTAGTCNALWPSWTFTRAQAGAPIAADKLKCDLKPVASADYQVTFNATQMGRLTTIFPGGICDWSKAGINQTPVVPYPSVGPSTTNLVFDITKP